MGAPDAASEWFSRRRLGLFLHFGLYSIEGWHEQDQMRRRIQRDEYENLVSRFNPVDFDADRILDLAESVGMEYVCLTAKHADGFCLWDTRQTDYNVMHAPYARDIVGALSAACHKREFPLGLYYSVVDWHHPNYPNAGRHHELSGPEPGDRPDWAAYMEYLRRQVTELCTHYGTVRHFFWDTNVPQHGDRSINESLRRLQPRIVINDRGFDEGDFGTPEREYQAHETAAALRFVRYTEACNSVGTQSWGYRRDEDYYSSEFLIRSMDAKMAKGGHYLLNVGPDARGRIPAKAASILRDVGKWYRLVREAFGDASPASELTGNRSVLLTRRGCNLYVHVPPPAVSEAVMLAPLAQEPLQAVLLNTCKPVRTCVELFPVHWQSGMRCLAIRDLPRNRLGGETLVVRLTFADPSFAAGGGQLEAFRG